MNTDATAGSCKSWRMKEKKFDNIANLKARREDYNHFLQFLSQASKYSVKSDRESGSRRGLAMIFELKVAASMDDLEKACKKGLCQIKEWGYEQELREDGYRNIKRYAAAFYKKDCEVVEG